MKIGVKFTVGILAILYAMMFYIGYLWIVSMVTGDVIGNPGWKSEGNSLCVGEQIGGYCK